MRIFPPDRYEGVHKRFHWFRWGDQSNPECSYCRKTQGQAERWCKEGVLHRLAKVVAVFALFIIAALWNGLVVTVMMSFLYLLFSVLAWNFWVNPFPELLWYGLAFLAYGYLLIFSQEVAHFWKNWYH